MTAFTGCRSTPRRDVGPRVVTSGSSINRKENGRVRLQVAIDDAISVEHVMGLVADLGSEAVVEALAGLYEVTLGYEAGQSTLKRIGEDRGKYDVQVQVVGGESLSFKPRWLRIGLVGDRAPPPFEAVLQAIRDDRGLTSMLRKYPTIAEFWVQPRAWRSRSGFDELGFDVRLVLQSEDGKRHSEAVQFARLDLRMQMRSATN